MVLLCPAQGPWASSIMMHMAVAFTFTLSFPEQPVIHQTQCWTFSSSQVSLWSLVRGNSKIDLFAQDEISSGNHGINILVAVKVS